jgi:aspartate/methionine/tyrosine aminotransferase
MKVTSKLISLSDRALEIDDQVFEIVLNLPPNVLRLTAGEPDFPCAPFVKEAAIKAINEDHTHYTPAYGIIPLREAIANKLRRENGLSYDPTEIIVTPGSSGAVGLILLALLDPGDEVLIPDPAWFHYEVLVKLAGGIPKRIPLDPDNGFRISAFDIVKKVTKKTKMLIINSPSNPTGRVLTNKELEEISSAAEGHNLTVLSDEIYEKIVYPPNVHKSIASLSGMKERTIVVNGFSKGYAMMGWRLGFAAAPTHVIKKLSSLLGYTLVCAGSVAQYAALEALRNPKSQEYANAMLEVWKRRRSIVMRYIEENYPVVSARTPEGTFYGWINVAGSGMNGNEVAKLLLKEAKVGVLPGYLFGKQGENYIRISFATSDQIVEEGMKRLCETLKEKSK